ncbi:uncharacterized protein LOC132699917 isoform X2 [Cylas formicarius]|uniref:uncharacterized protein LOC132699917 isoform X2 n=1 Tax=Cylas formicarius TaxID=197179 RepID=UPI002958AB5C|nr:uncharacterized protein LOC132699917 isoform X2 [Cylas formicarius]
MSKGSVQTRPHLIEVKYRTKEYISRVCCDIIEDILKQTFDEENPVSSAPLKCSRGSQTDEARIRYNYNLMVKQQIFESLIMGWNLLYALSTTATAERSL